MAAWNRRRRQKRLWGTDAFGPADVGAGSAGWVFLKLGPRTADTRVKPRSSPFTVRRSLPPATPDFLFFGGQRDRHWSERWSRSLSGRRCCYGTVGCGTEDRICGIHSACVSGVTRRRRNLSPKRASASSAPGRGGLIPGLSPCMVHRHPSSWRRSVAGDCPNGTRTDKHHRDRPVPGPRNDGPPGATVSRSLLATNVRSPA